VQKIAQTNDFEKKRVFLCDFATKAKEIRHEVLLYFIPKVLLAFFPSELGGIRNRMEATETLPPPKPKFDIAIITIKKPELLAAKIALGIDPNKPEDFDHESGLRFWKATRKRKKNGDNVNIVLTMVGLERQINCAYACLTLFGMSDVGMCILAGMGAGVKEKVNLGDVVAAQSVWDYEGKRLELTGPKKRPEIYNIGRPLARDLEHYDPNQCGWIDYFRDCLSRLRDLTKDVPHLPRNWKPRFNLGIIITGEKLVADDSLRGMPGEYHEKIRALDMESAGFAFACQERGVPWLVFRGISDFGDPDTKDAKDPRSGSTDVWQTTASLSAITAAINFIEHEYRARQKEKEF
jgi:nucleoside phosphorylase